MMGSPVWSLLVALYLVNSVTCLSCHTNETEARLFLAKYNKDAEVNIYKLALKMWEFYTNTTSYSSNEFVKEEVNEKRFMRRVYEQALKFNTSAMSEDVKRQIKRIIDNIGTGAQPNETKVQELASISSQMLVIQGSLDATEARSKSHEDLLEWFVRRLNMTKDMRPMYVKYVEKSNEAVRFAGFNDLGEQWRAGYELDSFVEDLQDLYNQLRPMYEQIHAYIRKQLKRIYGESNFPASGHIPEHYYKGWEPDLLELVKPFKNKTNFDVTAELIRQNYTVDSLYCLAEDFFISLGCEELLPSFWTRSLLKHPNDGRMVQCHATAWDFGANKDFRMILCTSITQTHLLDIHHELGHIYNYMEYSHLPKSFKMSANIGFHEATGDFIALSVQTPEHLKKLCLINELPTDNETDLNFLMTMALRTVAYIPFSYLVDKWRWSVFSGNTAPENYTKDWLALRCKLQGLSSPLPVTEEEFYPGELFHISSGHTYIWYFVSYILQFQFHKAACDLIGHRGPLHRCDIYNSKEVGRKLRNMMRLGASKPWPVALKMFTGQERNNASAMIEYFQPLMNFLRRENGNDYGWTESCPGFS